MEEGKPENKDLQEPAPVSFEPPQIQKSEAIPNDASESTETKEDKPKMTKSVAGISPENVNQLKETIVKYKKLLNMARQGLEDNQRHLSEKDKRIHQLTKEIETLKLKQQQKASKTGEPELAPRRILRRVDERGLIWALFEWGVMSEAETTPPEPSWCSFQSEEQLQDFIRIDCGEPILVPPCCMTSEEAKKVTDDAKAQILKVQDEFRKYKIKAEIARKQKEAEAKQALGASLAEKSRRIIGLDMEGELKRGQAALAQVSQLRQELAQQELMWRKAYDTLVRENEKLKTVSGESTIAAQWRQRYEVCVKEKEDLLQKLEGANGGSEVRANANGSYLLLESKYRCLKDEYKQYRKRAMEAMKAQNSGGELPESPQGGSIKVNIQNGVSIPGSSEAKIQYLKNLMLQYMCTAEPEPKEVMERAIFTVLRFSPEEQQQIQEKRTSAIGGLAHFFGQS